MSLEATQIFRRYLDRAPSATETNGVIAFLSQGHTPEQAAASFIDSPEFAADYGNAQDVYIEGLYQTILGRSAAPSEVDAWDNALAGGLIRPALVNVLLGSAGYLDDTVIADFLTFLGRPPSAGERSAFLAAMQGGLSSPMLEAIILDASFPQRT